jgi:NAD(P)-dependent dehydrogenase (short-subunit alcohol dehydrogenase family)
MDVALTASARRETVVVTGAAGGMGRACARLLGGSADLVLTDRPSSSLEAFAGELEADGYTIAACLPAEIGSLELHQALAAHLAPDRPFALVHTAGVSPSQTDWRTILAINLVATVSLLRTLDPMVAPGSAAVLIASMAGHSSPVLPGFDQLLAEPEAPDFLDRMGEAIAQIAEGRPTGTGEGIAYGLSKRAVIGIAEQLAPAWGARGARIVSLSPGTILTPMGRTEVAASPAAAAIAQATPAGRMGTAMDIANAVRFLCSREASFITGCDLRVDGGAIAAIRAMQR